MKRSFSLIELIVVMTILVVLLFVVSNFLISVLRQNNEININNEIRNEANRLMDQISTDLRSSKCETGIGSSTVVLYSSSSCSGSIIATYISNGSPNYSLTRNDVVLNSNSVKVRVGNCSTCFCGAYSSGLSITLVPSATRVYNVSLSLTQATDNPRADFCGKITTQKTISPRNRN